MNAGASIAPLRRLDAHQIAFADAEVLGGLRVDFTGRLQMALEAGIGQFLHPRQVRTAAIVELKREIGLEEERELRGVACECGVASAPCLYRPSEAVGLASGSSQMPPSRAASS